MRKKLSVAVALAVTVGACAAPRSEPKSPPSAAESTAPAPQQPAYPQGGAEQQGYAQPPAAAPPPPATVPADARKPSAAPGKAAEGPLPGRAMAIQSAQRDLESSQRELDVAAGDCTNACRALGSMDRAAGHLCGLAQEPDERRRCDDAKQRLYSARDRVRTTCGSCPGGASVDRGAPVPSLR